MPSVTPPPETPFRQLVSGQVRPGFAFVQLLGEPLRTRQIAWDLVVPVCGHLPEYLLAAYVGSFSQFGDPGLPESRATSMIGRLGGPYSDYFM